MKIIKNVQHICAQSVLIVLVHSDETPIIFFYMQITNLLLKTACFLFLFWLF